LYLETRAILHTFKKFTSRYLICNAKRCLAAE